MYNVLKFQSPFERLKVYNDNPEVTLCKAIITQAIIDSTCVGTEVESRKDRYKALAWIFGESEDFIQICDGADLEPSYVRKLAINAITLKVRQSNSIHD